MEFCNRDSDVYENIGIGFAGTGTTVTGPLPPLPLSRSSHPPNRSYENVELNKKQPKKKNKKPKKEEAESVEEDDEVLFGPEGPPGMQDIIYENFGPDKGNCLMSVEEMRRHVDKLGKKGISTEYYRVRNEPIKGAHKACRYCGCG